MSVRVLLPSALREFADGASELSVGLESETPLREVLDLSIGGRRRLNSRVRDETGALRRHVNVFVDGAECRTLGGLDGTVRPTSVVHIIASVSGG